MSTRYCSVSSSSSSSRILPIQDLSLGEHFAKYGMIYFFICFMIRTVYIILIFFNIKYIL